MTMPENAPRLEGWTTSTEIADALGVSRQTVNQMIRQGQFDTVTLLGPVNRPQYVIKTEELDALIKSRKFPQAAAG